MTIKFLNESGLRKLLLKILKALKLKQDLLTAGNGITISNNTIAIGNLKTINNTSLIGSTNIQLDGSNLNYTGPSGPFINSGQTINDIILDLESRVQSNYEEIQYLYNYTETSYENLQDLRDSEALIPGTWYRINDYITTTTLEDTQSAGHLFDILVLATSETTLSEEARAVQHYGDTYFNNSNLNAWKIWYSLDNNTELYNWADATNGKGVIYRMIDEFGNDCPYDFKNIQFKELVRLESNSALYFERFEKSYSEKYEYKEVYMYTFSGSIWNYTDKHTEEEVEILEGEEESNDSSLIFVGIKDITVSPPTMYGDAGISIPLDYPRNNTVHYWASDGGIRGFNFGSEEVKKIGRNIFYNCTFINCSIGFNSDLCFLGYTLKAYPIFKDVKIGNACSNIYINGWAIGGEVLDMCSNIEISGWELSNFKVGTQCSDLDVRGDSYIDVTIGSHCKNIEIIGTIVENVNIGSDCEYLLISNCIGVSIGSNCKIINWFLNSGYAEMHNITIGGGCVGLFFGSPVRDPDDNMILILDNDVTIHPDVVDSSTELTLSIPQFELSHTHNLTVESGVNGVFINPKTPIDNITIKTGVGTSNVENLSDIDYYVDLNEKFGTIIENAEETESYVFYPKNTMFLSV